MGSNERGGRMRRVSEVLAPTRAPTPEEAAEIAQVHEMVAEWAAGRLPAAEVARLTTGRQRWMVTRHTPPEHPRFRPLMALLDALIAASSPRAYRTRHGLIDHRDLADAGAKVEREDGAELVVFPVRYPWAVKPNPQRGDPGLRGEPVYRRREERGPAYAEFRDRIAGPAPDEPDDPRPWWDRD